jgi:hypothetical protein
VSAQETRGEWPGGIAVDTETGHLQFEIDPAKVAAEGVDAGCRPVWICPLCAGKRKHTQDEHTTIILAAKKEAARKEAEVPMREHLLANLDAGGHFFGPVTLELYPDLERLHQDDHRPGWWSEALMHDHKEPA